MVKWLDEIRERLGRVHAEWRDYNKCVICKEIGYAPKVRCFYYAGEDKQAAIRLLAALDAVVNLKASAKYGPGTGSRDTENETLRRVRQVIADAGGEK